MELPFCPTSLPRHNRLINSYSLPQNPICSPPFRCVFPTLLPLLRTSPIADLLAGDMAVDLLASAVYFPVVFFDGDREIDVGSVPLYSSLGFKKFQAIVSQRIGVSAQQISLSLVRRKKARVSPDVRRKVPIDETSDFASIVCERDCFILASLRRSRRERRGRSRRKGPGAGEEVALPELKILRRNPARSGFIDPASGLLVPEAVAGIGRWEYEVQLRNLQRQRDKFFLSAVADGPLAPFAVPRSPCIASTCEDCEVAKAEGRLPGFHWCVHDAVTVGFRSMVGPIQRPLKKELEASAQVEG
ncbi:hypothetical protein ZIOFF_011699 [Zingiber officinale]|uniref:DUF7138 domain-containing protein n=1 Tax=Zingiber officinale TaxID=94328 RepID=A0A8J5HR21_ZINOF|nr:hypothetical protein ZIOFF_011699 [Zingiber officinale]